jgi:hypothetical protein
MADSQEYSNATESLLSDVSVKLRDIEEKQNIIKDRVLLIGENLISEKEEVDRQIQELKSDMIKQAEETKKIKMAIERIIDDLNNFVRKNEFVVLQRQFKMFEPLELARVSDVENMINTAIKSKK